MTLGYLLVCIQFTIGSMQSWYTVTLPLYITIIGFH